MTIVGAVLISLALIGLARRTRPFLAMAIGISAGLPYSAGMVIGETGVPVFFCVGIVACLPLLRSRQILTRSRSAVALTAFVAWAVVITVLGPWVFEGIRVLTPRAGIDEQLASPAELTYTMSNLAQVGYLVVAVCVVLLLVRERTAATVLWFTVATGVGLSAVRDIIRLSSSDVLLPLFDTLPSVYYASSSDGRIRGVFSEPSELAAFALPAAALMTVTAVRSTGRMRAIATMFAVIAVVQLMLSASGTALVASVAVLAAGLVALIVRSLVRGGTGAPWFVLGSISVAAILVAAGDAVVAPALDLVNEKLTSQSYDARTGADSLGLTVLVDTFGFGAGLGSNRPSSFIVSLLSCVGVIGLALFAGAVLGVLRGALRDRDALPAVVALSGLIIAKSVATPDLSTPLLWVLFAACATPTWLAERDRDHRALHMTKPAHVLLSTSSGAAT